jgi:hypothetical protein
MRSTASALNNSRPAFWTRNDTLHLPRRGLSDEWGDISEMGATWPRSGRWGPRGGAGPCGWGWLGFRCGLLRLDDSAGTAPSFRAEALNDTAHRPLSLLFGPKVTDIPSLLGDENDHLAHRRPARAAATLNRPNLARNGFKEEDEIDVRHIQPFLCHAARDHDWEMAAAEPFKHRRLLALIHSPVRGVSGRLPNEPPDGVSAKFQSPLDAKNGVPVLREDEDPRGSAPDDLHLPVDDGEERVQLGVGRLPACSKEPTPFGPGPSHPFEFQRGPVPSARFLFAFETLQIREEWFDPLGLQPLEGMVEV